MQKKLSKKLKEEFALLLENHPPRQLSSALRDMLLVYMAATINTGFPLQMRQLLRAFNALFDLLDAAADELQQEKK